MISFGTLYDTLYQHHYFTQITIIFALTLLYLLYYYKFSNSHFLIKGNYNTRKKNLRKPPPPFPNGWYNIAKSIQIQSQQVKAVDINGRNLVVFRGKDKQIYALNAYCLHLGAHLGIGGQVVNGNCIQCPFHGWLYDGKTGNCVDHNGKSLQLKSIQYNNSIGIPNGKLQWKQKKPQKPILKKYPVVQVSGYIYVWMHANEENQQTPDYPMIDVSGFTNGLSYRGQTEHHIRCHLQDIPSNGADTLHFKYVHTYLVPWITSVYFKWEAKWTTADSDDVHTFFQHPRKQFHQFKQRIWKQLIEPYPNKSILSIGNLENWIHVPIIGMNYMFTATIIQVGLGIVFIILKAPLYQLVFHHYIRPEGVNSQIVYHDCYISHYIPYLLSSKIIQGEGGQVTNDLYVWQAKSFARTCYLNQKKQSDVIMKRWLEWSQQFYTGCTHQQDKDKYSW